MTNVRNKSAELKRGKMVYLPFWKLKEKFGTHAKAVRDAKYQLELTRDETDGSTPWWMPHPEVTDKDLAKHVNICVCAFYTYDH